MLIVFCKTALIHTVVSYVNWHAEIAHMSNQYIASTLFKASSFEQPIFYKLRSKIITDYGNFIAYHGNPNCKLLQDYYKLRQWVVTNYGRFITNYGKMLSQIMTKNY